MGSGLVFGCAGKDYWSENAAGMSMPPNLQSVTAEHNQQAVCSNPYVDDLFHSSLQVPDQSLLQVASWQPPVLFRSVVPQARPPRSSGSPLGISVPPQEASGQRQEKYSNPVNISSLCPAPSYPCERSVESPREKMQSRAKQGNERLSRFAFVMER